MSKPKAPPIDLALEQQLAMLRSELGPLIEKLFAAHPRMEMLLAHGIGLLTSYGVLDVVIVEHEARLKAQAASELLLEDRRLQLPAHQAGQRPPARVGGEMTRKTCKSCKGKGRRARDVRALGESRPGIGRDKYLG